MADCGSSDYQAIEYSGLFDLKNAQILRAEIVSIDQAADPPTAEITLLDVCEAYTPSDLSAVEFYYHCEDSTGTAEDLAKGYLAFSPHDIVYVLAVPETRDAPNRFYIVGHVDIRGTLPCVEEFLLVGLDGNVSGNPEDGVEIWITIFDVKAGEVLDLSVFQNKDELSPDMPDTFPCRFSVYQAWMEYNFAAATSACEVGIVIIDGYEIDSGTVTANIYETYSNGSNICNITKYGSESTTGIHSLGSENHLGLNYNAVTGYTRFEETRNFEDRYPYGTLWWELIDSTTESTIPVFIDFTATETRIGVWDSSRPITTNYDVDSAVSVRFKRPGAVTMLSLDFSSSIGGTSADTPATGVFKHCRSLTPIKPVSCTGAIGFYILALCEDDAKESDRVSIYWGGRTSSPVVCDWQNMVLSDPYHSSTGSLYTPKPALLGLAFANVTLFTQLDGVDLSVPVSLLTCIEAINQSLSHGLATAVIPLRQKIFEMYHSFWNKQKPSMFSALKRKPDA